MKWIVQELVERDGLRAAYWRDITTDPDGFYNAKNVTWEASDAGQAFHRAVLSNPEHKLRATSYRVLPYTGGATFNLALNVEAEEHEPVEVTT